MDNIYIKIADLIVLKKHFRNEDFVTIDDLIALIDELDYEIDDLKEQIEDLEQDIEDNYVPRKRSDYTGDSYDDRF